jgi:hypothetical protein
MGWFNTSRTSDPISERARALNEQIATLERQIEKLNSQATLEPQPRLRSTALPHGQTLTQLPVSQMRPNGPVFEEPNHTALRAHDEAVPSRAHYNDLGVRKYDLVAAWQRITNHFHGPSASNPKLINYLAAGSIQGLRPLRYEKRIARNRLILLVIVLIVVLTGIFAAYFRRG